MAHAYVDELKKIAADADGDDADDDDADDDADDGAKQAAAASKGLKKGLDKLKGQFGKAWGKTKEHGGKAWAGAKDIGSAKQLRGGLGHTAEKAHSKTLSPTMRKSLKKIDKARGTARSEDRRNALVGGAKTVGLYGGGAGAAGGAAYGVHRARKKEGSAIDTLAYERAVIKAAESGFDPEQAAERLYAASTLEIIPESTKMAAAEDVDSAIDIRSLELLEAAGYPVTWAA